MTPARINPMNLSFMIECVQRIAAGLEALRHGEEHLPPVIRREARELPRTIREIHDVELKHRFLARTKPQPITEHQIGAPPTVQREAVIEHEVVAIMQRHAARETRPPARVAFVMSER